MTDKHTPPIPWQRGQMDIIYSADCSEECAYHTPDHVVAVLSGTDSDAIDLIIRAVNSHALMLDALEELVALVQQDNMSSPLTSATTDVRIDRIRAAIAAATGEDACERSVAAMPTVM